MASEKTVGLDASSRRLLVKRYRLLERIDEGGAGQVWRARDERLDRDVAVKVLGSDADEAFRTRFADEARRAAAVVHPNVVTVFDEGRDGPDAFMVMELVPGKTLRDVVAERGPLPAHEVSRLIAQVAAALDAAHAAGVVHCDVKPANVIVDPSGIAKLTDFGIARAARDRDEQELLGTARYIAPERVTGGPVSARTDVYGLGLLAYELLAGRPAFDGTTNEELVRERLQGPPPPVRHARVGIDDRIDDVVTRSLSTDPERRYASAGAFARAFADAAEHGDPTTLLAGIALPRPVRHFALPRFDTTAALLAVVAVLLATVLFFASFPKALPAIAPPTAATPAARTTPDVVGKKVNEAGRILIDAGFRAPIPWQIDSAARGEPCAVARQEPAAGTNYSAGAPARLFLAPGNNCGKGG